jgi:hypothetical protein
MSTEADPSRPTRRRILRKIRIDEISGVDWPCQEGAIVTIMKRDPSAEVDKIREPTMSFEQRVAEIGTRENCSSTQALAKARRQYPEEFNAYNAVLNKAGSNDDFDALVEAQICKGCPTRTIAAQRVLQLYGAKPDTAAILKSEGAGSDFQTAVRSIQKRDACSRSEAASRARVEHPDLFAAYQEV